MCKDHDGTALWVQDCNVVVYNGNLAKLGAAAYDAIYQTGTANAGTSFCAWLWEVFLLCPCCHFSSYPQQHRQHI